MNRRESEVLEYYERALGWAPPFVKILARYSPDALDGYLGMRKAAMRDPPEGALPRKVKELLFVILDCVSGEANGAKAHARAAVDAGLSIEELVEAFIIAIMVTGIPTMCKAGVGAIEAARERLEEAERSPSLSKRGGARRPAKRTRLRSG